MGKIQKYTDSLTHSLTLAHSQHTNQTFMESHRNTFQESHALSYQHAYKSIRSNIHTPVTHPCAFTLSMHTNSLTQYIGQRTKQQKRKTTTTTRFTQPVLACVEWYKHTKEACVHCRSRFVACLLTCTVGI